MFNVKTPCKDCPFVKGSSTNMTLNLGRIEEIVEGLHNDSHFFCHKTIDYDNQDTMDEEEFTPTKQNQLCAGSLLYLEREKHPTQFMQVMKRFGEYQPEQMKGMEKIINPIT